MTVPRLLTAYSKQTDLALAVRTCTEAFAGTNPTLLIVFIGGKHDAQGVLSALRDAYPSIPIVGGSAAGVIARSGFGYSGHEIGMIAFIDPAVTPHVVTGEGMLDGEVETGRAVGKRLAEVATPDAVVLMLFDSVAQTAPLRLHPASLLIQGITDGLGEFPIRLIGGGVLTDLDISDSWIIDGDKVCKHAIVALVFPPSIDAVTSILHGCRPAGEFMSITRIEGAEVLELDDRPALTVIEELLGLEEGSASGQSLLLVATMGEKQGDLFAPYDENAYVNRLILNADPVRKSITLFEPDYVEGSCVQIMSRDSALMIDSVRRGVDAMNQTTVGDDCLLALYIDCAGRVGARSGAPVEEAELVRQHLDPALPMMGFYSGVEIAPFGRYSRPLDWTGVLTVLRVAKAAQAA